MESLERKLNPSTIIPVAAEVHVPVALASSAAHLPQTVESSASAETAKSHDRSFHAPDIPDGSGDPPTDTPTNPTGPSQPD